MIKNTPNSLSKYYRQEVLEEAEVLYDAAGWRTCRR